MKKKESVYTVQYSSVHDMIASAAAAAASAYSAGQWHQRSAVARSSLWLMTHIVWQIYCNQLTTNCGRQ